MLVLGVTALFLLIPGIASAKVPPFTVEASPNDLTAGDVVRLTVRFWDDRAHTDPARWPDLRVFDGLLWARPAGSDTQATPVDLHLVRPGVYRAELPVTSPGTWILCPWVRRCGAGPSMAGYPDRIEFAVASSDLDQGAGSAAVASVDSGPSRPPVPAVALSALAVAAAVLVGRSARDRRT